MPKMINISILSNCYDREASQCETEWDTLCQFLSEPLVTENKMDVQLFNGCQYSIAPPDAEPSAGDTVTPDNPSNARRRKNDLLSMSVLVIDVDNKDVDKPLTMEQARLQYSDYAHFGYTSHSHTPEQHRFRLLFPLETPIPMQWNDSTQLNGVWNQLSPALTAFFPAGDPASFKANQFFFIPSCSPSGESDAMHWCNEGKYLDWRQFELASLLTLSTLVDDDTPQKPQVPSGPYLHPDQVLTTSKGKIVVRDIKEKIQGVVCPFHADTRGTEFVNVTHKSGLPFLYCKRCGQNFYMHDPDRNEPTQFEVLSALDFGEPLFGKTYQSGEDRDLISAALDKSLKTITGENGYMSTPIGKIPKSHILYMPEGSGKSRLVISLAAAGHKVLFAVKSYAQLDEKLEEFRDAGREFGFDVDAIRSLDGVLQTRYGIKPIRHDVKTNPFKLGKVDIDSTVAEVIRCNPDVNETMVKLVIAFNVGSGRYEFVRDSDLVHPNANIKIVVTTFTMLRMLDVIFNPPPKSWTIWVDDPDASDLMDIAPVPDTVDVGSLKPFSVSQRKSQQWYYRRDDKQSFIEAFKYHRLLFTTTELNTLRLAKDVLRQRRNNVYCLHNEMHDIAGGRITILGTEKVRKSHDGLLPIIVSHVSQQRKKPLLLIADGLSAKFNHSNSKGKNQLKADDTVLEISIPHPDEIFTLCDALWLDPKKKFLDIRIDSMLDKLHQGLGRNTGYRSEGAEAVALVDPMYHQKIVAACRYRVDCANSQLIDKLQSQSRLDKRISDTATPLVVALEQLINRPDLLFLDNRKAKPTINRVVTDIQDMNKRINYLARLLIGLASEADFNLIDHNPDKLTVRKRQYKALIDWVLDEYGQDGIRERVVKIITDYYESLKPKEIPLETVP